MSASYLESGRPGDAGHESEALFLAAGRHDRP